MFTDRTTAGPLDGGPGSRTRGGPKMTNRTPLTTRTLHQHPEVAHIEHPAETLVKRDELLVLGRHADAVHDAARRWVDRREDFAELGLARLHLRPRSVTDAGALVHAR